MNQPLKSHLRPGESILWQGHPAGIRLTDPAFLLKNCIVWGFALFFAAAAVCYTWVYAPTAGVSPSFAWTVAGLLLLLAGYLVTTPFFSRSNLEQRVCYCMTNERMIAYRSRKGKLHMQSRDFIDFAEASIEPLGSGKANLYLGPKTYAARLELLSDLLPARETDQMMPLTFASIVDIEGACRCLPAYIHIDGYTYEIVFNRAAA